MDTHQFLSEALDISITLSKVFVAASPVLVVLGRVFIPVIQGSLKDKKHGEAFASLARMGVVATAQAADEIRKGLSEATAPSSPGGVNVTHEEMTAIIARAVGASIRWAKDQNVLKSVLDVVGGEEVLKANVASIVASELGASPAGVAVTVQSAPLP